MKTFHILTDYPILLNINSAWFEIKQRKNFSLQESATYNAVAFFCNNSFNPVAFTLNDNLSSDCKQIETFLIDENSIFIKITATQSNHELLLKDDQYSIYNGYATYYNQTKMQKGRFYATFCKKIFDNNIKLYSLENDDKKFLLGVKDDTSLIELQYDIIEIDNTSLTILNNLHDSFNQGIVIKYSLKDFDILEKYSVYMTSPSKTSISFVNLCPLFLEAGIGLNNNLSQKFLSENLRKNFSIKNFKEYFGDIEYFYQYAVSPSRANILIKSTSIKNYTFTMLNNKIMDIDEIK